MTNEITTIDTEIHGFYQRVQNDLANLEELSGKLKTNGVIEERGLILHIKTETNVTNLIKAGAFIANCVDEYNKFATEVLELKDYPAYEVNANSIEDLIHDIKVRIAVLTSKDRKEKLEKQKAKCESLFNEEQKRAKIFEELREEFE